MPSRRARLARMARPRSPAAARARPPARREPLREAPLQVLEFLEAQSEVITSSRPASSRELNVWENSSRRLGAAGEELHVVDQDHVRAAKALLEAPGRSRYGLDELARELLDGRVAHRSDRSRSAGRSCRSRAAGGSCRCPAARAGRAGCRPGRQLGDSQRRGVGEAVPLADHELVERVLGFRPGSPPGVRGWAGASIGGRRRTRSGRRPPRPPAGRSARPRAAQQGQVALGDRGADVLGRAHVEG